MTRLAPVAFALLSLAFSAAAAPVHTSVGPHAPPPPRLRTVLCTMLDGNPYSVTVEHGPCDLGETGGGDGGGSIGYDGNPLEAGSPAFNQCLVQQQRRLAQCNAMKGQAQAFCVGLTTANFALCQQNLPQVSSPVY